MKCPPIVWKEEYKVGVDWIDEQHQHFFVIVDKIVNLAGKKNVMEDEIFVSLGELSNYMLFHFAMEEEFLKTSTYPDVLAHIAKHEEFRNEVKKFIAEIRLEKRGPKKIADQSAQFACDWLSRHMLGIDKERLHYLKTS